MDKVENYYSCLSLSIEGFFNHIMYLFAVISFPC